MGPTTLWSSAVLLAALCGCATQQARAPLAWNAEAISQSSASVMRLQGRQGETIATVRTDRIRKIVDSTRRIEKVAGAHVRILITDGKAPNAFAWQKDGINHIGFTVGMLDLLQSDYDAYAAIIGHELAHLVLNHGALRKDRESARAGVSQVLGFVLGAAGVPLSGTVANVTTRAVTTSFSRDEERDADRYGINYAREAGFDPYGAVRAWEKMAARSSGVLLPFLSTHPMAEERIENMRVIAAASPIVINTDISTSKPAPADGQAIRFSRLRPIGEVHDSHGLPRGDLYVDMNSIAPNVKDLTSTKASFLVNLPSRSPQAEMSLQAHALVNCSSTSLAIIRTVSSSEPNGDGQAIATKDYQASFTQVTSGSVLENAIKAVCEQ